MDKPEYLTCEHLPLKDIIRIFKKIRVNLITGCWEWTGSRDQIGYGHIKYQNRTEKAHRLLYAFAVEPIPRGLGRDIPQLDHIVCSNPPCCNPAHMKLGPSRINILRGSGPCAIHARQTHCLRGHLLPEPNRQHGRGRVRQCIPCKNAGERERRQRKRLATRS